MTAQNTDHLLEDAAMLVMQASNGFAEGDALAEMLAAMERTELMQLIGRLASMVDMAIGSTDRDDFELKLAYMRLGDQQ